MKIILTVAAAAIAFGSTPALAQPGGHGHGNSGKQWSHDGDRRDRVNYGYHNLASRNCPPGLAKKHNGCMAPGQARKIGRWSQGDRLPSGYRSYTPYDQLPQRYVDQYNLDPNARYVYRDNTIYQVDPRTQIIQRILGGLIR